MAATFLCMDTYIIIFSLFSIGKAQNTPVYIGTGAANDDGSNIVADGNDIIVLGGLFPVHNNHDAECGIPLELGMQNLEAMVLAIRQINNNPEFLPGVTLAFELRDTCTISIIAREESLKFVGARNLMVNGTILGISGVVGAASSRSSIAVARLFEIFSVPQISYASTASVLSDKTMFEYFFRTVQPDSLQAKAMADIIDHFNWTYVIAMHTDDIYGTDGINTFIRELQKRNATTQRCVAASSIALPLHTSAEEFDHIIEILDEEWISNATVIVLFSTRETANGLLQAVAEKRRRDPNFHSRNFTWIASDAWGERILPELYDVAQGTLSVIPRTFVNKEFDTYFQSLHPTNNTANPWFMEYWESKFNCTLSNRPGFEQCDTANQFISPETGYRQSGFAPFTIDAVYALAHAIRNLQQDFCPNRRGVCMEIMDTRAGIHDTVIRGDLLLQYLHNVSFRAASTEFVSFDSNGDQQGGYLIKNLKQKINEEFIFDVIGHWDEVPTNRSAPLEIFGDIQWSHGQGNRIPSSVCSLPCGIDEFQEPVPDHADCCWICRSCQGPAIASDGSPSSCSASYLMWSDAWAILVVILCCSGIIATTIVIVIFIVYHKHILVKESSRELVAVLLGGIMLSFIVPFFYVAQPAPWSCAIRRFGFGVSLAICYSALLVKTNQIHRIFNRPSGSPEPPPLISSLSQLFFAALLVNVQVVIGAMWFVAEKPTTAYFYGDSSTELSCGASPYIGTTITFAYNVALLLVTVFFAFRTINVKQNLNEANFINATVYILCILWLFLIPIYYGTANLGAAYQNGTLMLFLILSASVILCIFFMPKTLLLLCGKQAEKFSNLEKTALESGSVSESAVSVDASIPQFDTLQLTEKNVDKDTMHAKEGEY